MKTVTDLKWEAVEDVARLVRAFLIERHGSLGGMCGVAADYIVRLLKVRGIQATGVEGLVVFQEPEMSVRGYHVWVEVEGLVVDATADQFNTSKTKFRPIIIGPYAENTYHQVLRRFEFMGRPLELEPTVEFGEITQPFFVAG